MVRQVTRDRLFPLGVDGLSHKSDGDACLKTKLKPLSETNVGVAQA